VSALSRAWLVAAAALLAFADFAAALPPRSIAASIPSRAASADAPSAPAAPAAEEPRKWWTEDDWEWVDHERAETEEASERKSVWKAVGASALLPGLGQRYAGRSKRAGFFFVTEAAIWTTFAVYRIQGEIRQDRFIEFAGTRAGAPDGEEDDYYEHIGFFSSLEQWHDIVRRDARFLFPDDPAAQAEYFEQTKRYDESEAWVWPDDETRTRYRVLRSRSEGAFHNSRLALGAALLNRFASVIDALALTRKHNQDLGEEGLSLDLRFETKETADGLVVGPVLTAQY
jgi:hypothetical protein